MNQALHMRNAPHTYNHGTCPQLRVVRPAPQTVDRSSKREQTKEHRRELIGMVSAVAVFAVLALAIVVIRQAVFNPEFVALFTNTAQLLALSRPF